MRIAVATDDRVNVSPHLGKAGYFIFYEVEEGKSRIERAVGNPHAEVHAREERQGGHRHGHGHGHSHGHGHDHSHEELFALLSGCDATISRGIGPQMAAHLRDRGIEPYILEVDVPAEEAVRLFLSGKVRPVADRR